MPLPIELIELRTRLEEVGMVVVQEPDHLTVRLPYFCSVRIYSDDGRLRFEPYLGMVPRTRATMIKLGVLSLFMLLAFRIVGRFNPGMIGIAILIALYDAMRVMITENVITRASIIYSQMPRVLAPQAAAAAPRAIGYGSAEQLAPRQATHESARAVEREGSRDSTHEPLRDALRHARPDASEPPRR